MGLFGGFKAKFTRNSPTKVKPQEVVCLKYHIHSEFDQQEVTLPIQDIPNTKKNEVVRGRTKAKSRKELSKSAIFQENDTDYSYLSTPKTPQKSLSLTNLNGEVSKLMHRNSGRYHEPSDSITVSTTIEMPSNGNSIAESETKFGRSVENRNGIVTEKVAIVTNNYLQSTSKNSKTEKQERTILKSFSTHDDHSQQSTDDEENDTRLYNSTMEKPISNYTMNRGSSNHNEENETHLFTTKGSARTEKPTSNYTTNGVSSNDKSTLIFMTQASSDSDKIVEREQNDFDGINFSQTFQSFGTNKMQNNFDDQTEDDQDGNFKINFTQNNDTPKEEYKVNIVQHDLNRSNSYSEDEGSYHEPEPPVFHGMKLSRQAASIFFGEDIEPEIARPRRILLRDDDDDDRRSSGADC